MESLPRFPADLVTVTPTARHTTHIEVGHGAGSHSHTLDLYSVRRQADGMGNSTTEGWVS
jgi:hypothetical protein